ncbi:MAG TPA: hypothetical protein VM013_08075, partial [Dehalococcoidia bacterium]|nr:hypothetical protein [Dehalococcoidia bacterium]
MYADHPFFRKPIDQNATIWRYTSFAKLVSVFDRQALFFARADTLPDRFEGSYPSASVQARSDLFKYVSEDARGQAVHQWSSLMKNMTTATFLNCWCVADKESVAMWNYLKNDEAVAIRSSFRKLAASFHVCTAHQVFIGQVEYVDYDRVRLPEGNTFFPFLYKREQFEHERELRAVVQALPVNDKGTVDWSKPMPMGIYVNVDVNELLEEIR